MNDKQLIWQVTKKVRLTSFLQEKTRSSLSLNTFKKVIEKGLCQVNGKVQCFSSTQVEVGDYVALDNNWEKMTLSQKEGVQTTLYEDEYLFIVNKPSGWISEEKKERLYPVHRLDRGTSGVWILAKTRDVREKMMDLFAKREVKKEYIAIVDGVFKEKQGKIESLLRKIGEFQGQTIWGSSHTGLPSTTYYTVIGQVKKRSAVLCRPVTGRMHQIRVHLMEKKHAILGDYQYCKEFSSPGAVARLMLHSWRISFVHPYLQKKIMIRAPIPDEFFLLIPSLKKYEKDSSS
ncbi:MAG: RluA family pseudouridine synthase [Chlamydiota bacterium]